MLIQIKENQIINPDHITHIRVIGDTLKIYFSTGTFDDVKISLEEFKEKLDEADWRF